MINTVTNFLKSFLIPKDKLECIIDEEKVDCDQPNDPEPPYLGFPAPVIMPIDEWFVDSSIEPVKTEKQITHEEMLEEAARREEENNQSNEPENIHQVMYEMATSSWTTVGETQGGSENVLQSGTGLGQFR